MSEHFQNSHLTKRMESKKWNPKPKYQFKPLRRRWCNKMDDIFGHETLLIEKSWTLGRIYWNKVWLINSCKRKDGGWR